MIDPGQKPAPSQSSCYFDELHIRARSAWHRKQYNEQFEAAKLRGLSVEQARAHAVEVMRHRMGDSGIRLSAR